MSKAPEEHEKEQFTDLFLASVQEYKSMVEAYLKTDDMEHTGDPEATNQYMEQRGGSKGPVSQEQLDEASAKLKGQLEEFKWTYGVNDHDNDLDQDQRDTYQEALWMLNETLAKLDDAEQDYDKEITDNMDALRDTIEEYVS